MLKEYDVAPDTRPQDAMRARLDDDVAKYLAKGGKIDVVPIQSYKTIKAQMRELAGNPNLTAKQKRHAANKLKGMTI